MQGHSQQISSALTAKVSKLTGVSCACMLKPLQLTVNRASLEINRLLIADATRQEIDREVLSLQIFSYLPHQAQKSCSVTFSRAISLH